MEMFEQFVAVGVVLGLLFGALWFLKRKGLVRTAVRGPRAGTGRVSK